MREYLENILAPRLQGDGGWVEYADFDGKVLTCVFRGECSKCHILDRCTAWMEERILKDLGEHVTVRAVRKKPYFWDAK